MPGSLTAPRPAAPAAVANRPTEKFAQRRTAAHMRQFGAGDARQHHPAAGGHHHRVRMQADDVVGRNLMAQFDLRGAAADLVAQLPQEGLVLGVQYRRPQQRAAELPVAFEQRDAVPALGRDAGGLHTGRTAADHHDVLGVRCAGAPPVRAPCRSADSPRNPPRSVVPWRRCSFHMRCICGCGRIARRPACWAARDRPASGGPSR